MNNSLKYNLVFLYKENNRNIGLFNQYDKYITYGEGDVVILRYMNERDDDKQPLKIGQFFYYKLSVDDIIKEGLNIPDVLSFLDGDDSVRDFTSTLNDNNEFHHEVLKQNKLILVSYLVITKEARKDKLIFSQFLESFRKVHHSKGTTILGYFKPIQYNEYFRNFVLPNKVEVLKNRNMDGEIYYDISKLSKGDYEQDVLKILSLTENNFKPIDVDRFIFQYHNKN